MRDPALDISELTELNQRLLSMMAKDYPKESKKFLQKEGNKLRNATKKKARQKKIKKTGNYIKSIKRGKMYKFNGDMSIRVYSSAPHAHLVEYGHRIVSRKKSKKKRKTIAEHAGNGTVRSYEGSEGGFVKGHKIFERTKEEFSDQFTGDCEDFLTELIEGGIE